MRLKISESSTKSLKQILKHNVLTLPLHIMTALDLSRTDSVFHSFMHAGRRHGTGSETKDFVTYSPAGVGISYSHHSCLSNPMGIMQMQVQVDARHVVLLLHSLKTLSLINPDLIKHFKQTRSTFVPEGAAVFIAPYGKQTGALLQMKMLSFSFRAFCSTNILKKMIQKQNLTVCLLTGFAEM